MKLTRKMLRIISNFPLDLKKRLFGEFVFLILFNIGVWISTLLLWNKFPILLGLVTLSYGLGLRHAVDADHIAAIDNSTRKLMNEGKKPVSVGLFFSLGHSTIVILLSTLLAISTGFIKNHLPSFETAGSIIGTIISSFFLLSIGIINLMTLIGIFKTWKLVLKGKKYSPQELHRYLDGKGAMTKLLKPLLKTVSNSWNMYIVGFLFGLGFDTASEVGLLSVSAASGVSGMPLWAIILLPLAFTAGMSLIDTLDGILMLGAYGWAYIKPVRKLYYNLNITFISVVIALFIGSVEAMQLIIRELNLKGELFNAIISINFASLGYIIIATFIISWGLSVVVYKFKKYDRLEI